VLPEQMGVWSQPLEHDTPEAACCNMVNAMLGRIHQSGFITSISPQSLTQVTNGIAVYKRHIRRHVPEFIPFYPLGMADMTIPYQPAALGMRAPEKTFVAVWRRDGPEEVHLPYKSGNLTLLYPADLGIRVVSNADGYIVKFPNPFMGCILAT
jgi:alpha-galactosidase